MPFYSRSTILSAILLVNNAIHSFAFIQGTKSLRIVAESGLNSCQTPRKQFSLEAKGFGASKEKSTKSKKPNKKTIVKQLQKTYGGTSPEDIARGTQRIIDRRLKGLPPHFQIAVQLYQQLQQWNYRLQGMTVLQQANLPTQEMDGANRAQEELDRLMNEHDFTTTDLHNLLQVATWDASADAKAARSVTGNMPIDIERRVQRGCDVVGEAVADDGRCLDVGCGFGVMLPYLRKAGVSLKQIHGIDLSPEMIRNAESLNPGASWEAGDFFQYQPDFKFDSILFCSSLHDLPDPMEALQKAGALLNPGGKIVIIHPQGASHVQNQVRSNPVLVQRGLPSSSELSDLDGLELEIEPAVAKSQQEAKSGYLAVLKKS